MKKIFLLLTAIVIVNFVSLAQYTIVAPDTIKVPGLGTDVLLGQSDTTVFSFSITSLCGGDAGVETNIYIDISGADAARFKISLDGIDWQSQLNFLTDVNEDLASQNVYVQYTPTGLGYKTVSLDFSDEYSCALHSHPVAARAIAPEIDILGGSTPTSIANGDVTPALGDWTIFTSCGISGATTSRTYTIKNTSSGSFKGDLNLIGTPKVSISGTNAADFTLTSAPVSPVGPDNATTTFTITFDPSAVGARNATLTIANNDENENPYTYSIRGTGNINTPTVQASNITFTSVGQTSMTINWTSGNGEKRIVAVRETNQGTFSNPVDATTYTASTDWSSKGSQLGTSGYYVVYMSTSNSVTLTNLVSGTTYWVQICEFNGTGATTKHYTATATGNPNSQATTKAAPSLQATDIVFSTVLSTTMDISWTVNGTCDGLVVALKASSAISVMPVDNNTYNASSVFMAGDVVGSSGTAYCVYNGTGTTVSVTGLSPNTTYYCRIFQYNNSPGTELYNTNTATNNPRSQSTATAVPNLLSASNVGSTSFYANWQTVSGADRYYLDVSTLSDFSSYVTGWQNVNVGNVATYNVSTNLTAGSSYYFRVRSYNTSTLLTSDNTGSPMSVTLKCVAPVATAATNIAGTSFTANWGAVTGADDYRLDVSTSSGFGTYVSGYQDLTVLGTSQSVTGLVPNTAYYYRVRASNSSGSSNHSNTITLTTLNEYVWTGTTNNDWFTASNWDQAAVPTSAISVRIPDVTNDPVIKSATLAACNDLTIEAGGNLYIAGKVLTPGNDYAAGSLTVSGNISNAGLISLNAGPGGYSGSLITNGTFVNIGAGNVKFSVAMSKGAVSPFTRWHCVSSPITGAATATVFANSMSNRYKYNETLASPWVAADATMAVGTGYYVAYNANKYESFTSTGTLNYSAVGPISLSYTPAGRSGFNLIGNPFPCSLDWNSGAWTLTNVGATIQIKNGDNYATFTKNGTGTNGGTQYIQPGQGFFVVASAATSITIPTGARVHNTGSAMLKSISPLSFIRFKVSDATLSSESIIMFDDNATNEFDMQIDAQKLFSDNINTPEVYCLTPVAHDTLVVDAVPYHIDLVKPIGVKIKNTGTYTIKANLINGIDPAIPLYLEDTETGTYTDLRIDSMYTFTISVANYNNAGRFNLRFYSIQVPPAITSQSPSTENCIGEAVTFDVVATGNPTYQWHGPQGPISGATTPSYQIINATETDAGSYYCVVTNIYGYVLSNNVVLTIKIPASVTQQPASSTVCQNQNAVLNVSATGTDVVYQWQKDGSDLIGQTSAVLALNNVETTDAGNYLCVISNSCNSITTSTAVLTINTNPAVNLGSDITSCEGTIIMIDAGNSGSSFIWNNGSGNQTIDVTTDGSYSVTVTSNGCESYDAINVLFNAAPFVELGNDISVCNGTLVTLDAGYISGNLYTWSNGSHNQTISPSVSGMYSVTITNSYGCTGNGSTTVTFNQIPVVNLGNDISVCSGTPVILDAGNTGAGFVWSDQSILQQLDITQSGTYGVTVTQNGCSSSDVISVNIKSNPVVVLGSDISVCQGTSVNLDAGYVMGNSYTWSNGSHNQIIHPTTAGTYTVTVTNNGCSGTDNINVSINVNPAVSLGTDLYVCELTPVVLDAGNASSYYWSTGEITQTINVTIGGQFSVTVTDNSCQGSDAVVVTFKPTPVVSLGADASVCQGSSLNLDAGYISGNMYSWSNGQPYQVITVNETGIYAVTVTNNGCTGTDEINVTVNSNPVVDLGPDVAICSGCTETIDAGNPGSTYVWSNGATTQTIDVTVSGTYSVTVISPEGCSSVDEIIVDVVSGISTNTLNNLISVYPNPAINTVTISTGIEGIYIISIIDITGKVILSTSTEQKQNVLDISNLENGIYLIRISNAETLFINTLIKQ